MVLPPLTALPLREEGAESLKREKGKASVMSTVKRR